MLKEIEISSSRNDRCRIFLEYSKMLIAFWIYNKILYSLIQEVSDCIVNLIKDLPFIEEILCIYFRESSQHVKNIFE